MNKLNCNPILNINVNQNYVIPKLDFYGFKEACFEQYTKSKWKNFESVSLEISGSGLKLGDLLLKGKKLTSSQRDISLGEQKNTGEKLGALVLRKGLISEEDLFTALTVQQRNEMEDGPLRLGNILIAMGIIDRQQLLSAIHQHRETGKRLGEILINLGEAKDHQVTRCLALQERLLRSAVLLLFKFSRSRGIKDIDGDTIKNATSLKSKS
jgi:hypothetical protein